MPLPTTWVSAQTCRAAGSPFFPATIAQSLRRNALAAVSLLALGVGPAHALDDQTAKSQAGNEALLKKLEAMERRIQMLEGQLKQKHTAATPSASTKPASAPAPAGTYALATPASAPPAATPADTASEPARKPILGLADSPIAGLSIGAYGEFFFGTQQNPAAGGQWQNGFDARRFVLLPTYQITDNIIFNAEIEFEHAGSGFDNDDKLHGTAEIEQLWVDFKLIDQFNWRAPGIDLVPIGYINQHHEPTQFYSVLRPELYNGLIPSTWKVPGSSVYGTLTEGVKYQVMVSASQEDFGDSADLITPARTVPPYPIPYFPGVDGLSAL